MVDGVNIWSSGRVGMRMSKRIWMRGKKMDDGYVLVSYAFPAHLRFYSPVSN